VTVLAIDPGPEQSAFVLYRSSASDAYVIDHGKGDNPVVLRMLAGSFSAFMADALVIEQIASYGMPVGREVFDTVHWAGRFYQKAQDEGWTRLYQLPRLTVKLHLCQSPRATDATIRQALIDRFGGSKAHAVGTKNKPGPLYGLKADGWAALALAVTFADQEHAGAFQPTAVQV